MSGGAWQSQEAHDSSSKYAEPTELQRLVHRHAGGTKGAAGASAATPIHRADPADSAESKGLSWDGDEATCGGSASGESDGAAPDPLLSADAEVGGGSAECPLSASQVELAALLVTNASLGIYDPKWSDHRRRWMRMQRWDASWAVRAARAVVLALLLLVPFFEQPAWCRLADRQQLYANSYLQAAHANSTGVSGAEGPPPLDLMPACGDSAVYPNSNLPQWSLTASLTVDLLLLLSVLLVWVGPCVRILGLARLRQELHLLLVLCLSVLGLLDLLLTALQPALTVVRLVPLIRPLLFLCLVPGVRMRGASTLRSVRAVLPILLCLLLLLLLYSWLGCLLFPPSSTLQGQLYFPDYWEAMWSFQILLTTANYPDVAMNALRQERSSQLFFSSFLFIGLWFLLPLLLAAIYASYHVQAQHAEALFAAERLTGLAEAFHLLREAPAHARQPPTHSVPTTPTRHAHTAKVQPQQRAVGLSAAPPTAPGVASPPAATLSFLAVMHLLMRLLFGCEYPTSLVGQSQLNPQWNRARLYFLQLDVDQSGAIHMDEFARLCTLLDQSDGLRGELLQHRRLLPANWPVWHAPWFRRLARLMAHRWRNHAVVLVVLAHTAVICAQSAYWSADASRVVHALYCSTDADVHLIPDAALLQSLDLLLVLAYAVELCADVATQGFFPFWHSAAHAGRNRFQLTIVLASVAMEATLGILAPSVACAAAAQGAFLCLRALRVTRALLLQRHIAAIVVTYFRLVPQFAALFALLWVIIVLFGQIGMMCFGGVIWVGSPSVGGSLYYHPSNYYILNFNDLGSAMCTLFALLVVNNWFVLVDGFVSALASRWYRLFFLAFYYAAVSILLNLCVAFVLDTFLAEWDHTNQHSRDDQTKEKANQDNATAVDPRPTAARTGMQ